MFVVVTSCPNSKSFHFVQEQPPTVTLRRVRATASFEFYVYCGEELVTQLDLGRIRYLEYFEISGSEFAGSVKLQSGSGFGFSGYPD
ncbi:hypothetical protein F2Q69_00036695 [Brassica cretica]|uniref:Uncharacterized protein n=1 Tax=Brassica cretica TaxID=69181 RepID=A0A8S9SAX9_BRACR|nr:hypothetical protein F2Q69_00036695 [Brassica cretica]